MSLSAKQKTASFVSFVVGCNGMSEWVLCFDSGCLLLALVNRINNGLEISLSIWTEKEREREAAVLVSSRLLAVVFRQE